MIFGRFAAAVYLLAQVLSLPINETMVQGQGTEISANEATTQEQGGHERIEVSNMKEIGEKHGQILSDMSRDVIFVMKESKSYLVRKKDGNKGVENIDGVGDKNNTKSNKGRLKDFIQKVGQRKSRKNQWVEVSYEDTKIEEYPGYIPVSSCQSQESAQDGSIGFSFSLGESVTLDPELDISYTVSIVTLKLTLGVSVSGGATIEGSTSCTIGSGKVGQIILKPRYMTATPMSRNVAWDSRRNDFHTDPDFKRYTKMHVLLEKGAYEVNCATNDVIDLFCDGQKLGEANWDNPLTLNYKKPQEKTI